MNKYELFKQQLFEAAERFKDISRDEQIRIVSHLDADGICACSILIHALNTDNRRYTISIVPQLDKKTISEIAKENYNTFVFTDLGSGSISLIKEKLPNKNIFIFDHHQPEKIKARNITHVNPHLFGIDGSSEISGAGVVYLFTKNLNKKNTDMAHIAVVGAIGDVQEDNGFGKLNNGILEESVKKDLVKVKKGLKVFGSQTKPIYKVLERSNIFIPGITGNESSAIKFLYDLKIDLKKDGKWRRMIDLTDEEMKKLIAGVVMQRVDEEEPTDVLGFNYILNNEKEGSPFRDAKEFATLLNACGRMGKASLGIGACMNDTVMKASAMKNLTDYRREIMNAMRWVENNGKNIIKNDGFMIINAEDNIMHTIIGTVASILSKSNTYKKGFMIMSLARAENRKTKVSLRITSGPEDVDLRDIIAEVTSKVGGEAGGHRNAAGALIKTEDEERFIKTAKEVLGSFAGV